ncbi:efflux RND transporter periplasmic adaptor subunit [Aliikangiella marina]|uniref:Efflux RND transporter periplasmic adaptor subunit n=1 Tax=Aliikangiella marina TaxID=1712262 RepID=A0A545T537_9GAMM|nr:efflux RND transporter periplasmic adaptor subunit [Aliikangiella marina]TQV72357.1 efflux RND transporter periplasmic adaptor subunit [Aliikangiella marina]
MIILKAMTLTKTNLMKRPLMTTSLLLFGLAASTTILSSRVIAAEAGKEPPASLVTTKAAKQQQVSPTIWLAGNVINRMSAQISAEQSGRLTQLLDIGESVKAGDIIAKLDARELELQIAERKAQLRRHAANIDYLSKQQDRLSALLDNNSTARIELDRVTRDLNIAEEERNSLKIQIKQIRLTLDRATIRAPFSGKINRKLAEVGEYVTVGTTLVELVDPSSIDVSVAAPFSVAPHLQQQGNVLIKWQDKLESVPVRTWSPAGDQASRTFNVRLDASSLGLVGGSSVSVSLPSDQIIDSTMVPRDALILRDKQTFVVTVDDQLQAKRIEVSLGRGVGDWISVAGSINPGDQVIIRGGERLRDGQKVRIAQTPINTSESIAAN